MSWWARLSGFIFKSILAKYEDRSPSRVLQSALMLLDEEAIQEIKGYLCRLQTPSGGFPDKGGRQDLYYTLFGFLLAEALEMKEVREGITHYVNTTLHPDDLKGVHLYCAYILAAKCSDNRSLKQELRQRILSPDPPREMQAPAYEAFLKLFTFYYTDEYLQLYRLRQQLKDEPITRSMPAPVLAACLVIRKSFGKSVSELQDALFQLYREGGFRAAPQTPVPDLLSTAVALYALQFSGADLRAIRPDCLNFIDSLYSDGGFGGHVMDPDPDIEYTFYGLLGLGALTEKQ